VVNEIFACIVYTFFQVLIKFYTGDVDKENVSVNFVKTVAVNAILYLLPMFIAWFGCTSL